MMWFVSEQFNVHVFANVGNSDRFETLFQDLFYLGLAILSKAPWKVGGGRKFKELSIFGWSFKKPGRRYQVQEPARLFKDFGGTRGEVGGLM